MNLRERIDFSDSRFETIQLVGGDKIGLVEDDHICGGDLSARFRAIIELLVEMLCIDNRDDRVEPKVLGQFGSFEGVDHRVGISKARRFDQHIIEAFLLAEQIAQTADQITSDATAETAVVQLKDLFVGAHDELIVDANGAKLVDDDGAFVAVLLREERIEQRGLACSKKAGQNRDWNPLFGFHEEQFAKSQRVCRNFLHGRE